MALIFLVLIFFLLIMRAHAQQLIRKRGRDMKILKRGALHQWKAYTLRCALCGTEVEILKGDPEIIEYYDFPHSFREDIKWTCPICATEVTSSTPRDRGGAGTNYISSGIRKIRPEECAEIDTWKTVWWQEGVEERNYDLARFTGVWENK